MGSEGTPAISVHITGFKKFQGVAENPTETIVSNLPEFMKRKGIPAGITLGSCTVLETAGVGALPRLYQTMESFTDPSRPPRNEQVIWVHFGVNSGAFKFAIERQAVNEATFRCPDELGWQPQQHPIIQEDGGIFKTRETSCSVDAIVKFLKNKGFDVANSDDAGRFVCNYVYYHSLRYAEEKGHKSLFVHVPLFSRINEDTQMQFAASLLEALASFT
ncbi:pyrrolidone-carboxylate peptidase-like [Telopea speciosissima]|uniref:pyrrolidone-carboxylate peptidase-like n=1 Tax=Telopea speciosissima TaxID=54955 RepID=UPI001CC48C98|nr:pyrrolidone-carboxylate peptidase-like [Telopea speciosissima]XP_043706690.1 pyrrolidone-carboxylate peptidase-like [Telopea speciosissima]